MRTLLLRIRALAVLPLGAFATGCSMGFVVDRPATEVPDFTAPCKLEVIPGGHTDTFLRDLEIAGRGFIVDVPLNSAVRDEAPAKVEISLEPITPKWGGAGKSSRWALGTLVFPPLALWPHSIETKGIIRYELRDRGGRNHYKGAISADYKGTFLAWFTGFSRGSRSLQKELVAAFEEDAPRLILQDIGTPQPLMRLADIHREWKESLASSPGPGVGSGATPDLVAPSSERRICLAIGINQYKAAEHFPTLNNAVNDAEAVAEVLGDRYDFDEVEVLRDQQATAQRIHDEIAGIANRAREGDVIVIYFSGHGELTTIGGAETKEGDGYWVPYDAEPGNVATLVSSRRILDYLSTPNMRKVKHLALVSDSCFSGSFADPYPGDDGTRNLAAGAPGEQRGILNTGGSLAPAPILASADPCAYRATLHARPSRHVLSSGSREPVPDGAPGSRHSRFTRLFLDGLLADRDCVSFRELGQGVRDTILQEFGGRVTPLVGGLKVLDGRDTSDPYGDLVLTRVRRTPRAAAPAATTSAAPDAAAPAPAPAATASAAPATTPATPAAPAPAAP